MDYSIITNSARYQADKNKKKLPVWLQLLPPVWVLAIVWFFVRIPLLLARQKERSTLLGDFAAAHSMTYRSIATDVGKQQSLGFASLLSMPYESVKIDRVADRIMGNIGNMPFEYTAASVKLVNPLNNKKDARGIPITTTFFRLRVPVDLPNVYLQPKFGFHRGVHVPPSGFEHPHKYVLEGNFVNFYDVIGERDERLDIYQVLSPEVMEALVEHSFYDIWLHGREIVLVGYGAGREQYFTQLPIAFTVATMLTRDVDRIARALRHK